MRTFIISLKFLLIFTVLTGAVYPLFITGFARLLYPEKSKGSLIVKNGKATGSLLIGQTFDSSIYFTSRPSAISYQPLPSGGSNYCLTNRKLKGLFDERKKEFILFNDLDSLTQVPSEMLFASGSGLDPHISPECARMQIGRVARARNFNGAQKQELMELIDNLKEPQQFLVLGEERINVLVLNLETDKIH